MTPTALDSTSKIVQKVVQQLPGTIWLLVESHNFLSEWIACRDTHKQSAGNILNTVRMSTTRTMTTHLSTPVFVTETVSPIRTAEPATGCYLKVVPCGNHETKVKTNNIQASCLDYFYNYNNNK